MHVFARVELLFTLCYEIPCILLSGNFLERFEKFVSFEKFKLLLKFLLLYWYKLILPSRSSSEIDSIDMSSVVSVFFSIWTSSSSDTSPSSKSFAMNFAIFDKVAGIFSCFSKLILFSLKILWQLTWLFKIFFKQNTVTLVWFLFTVKIWSKTPLFVIKMLSHAVATFLQAGNSGFFFNKCNWSWVLT